MRKRYILPAVTADGQDTSIGVLSNYNADLREWLSGVRRRRVVRPFRFSWTINPRSIVFPFLGELHVVCRRDGIYIEERLLSYEECYSDAMYSLDEFCRRIFKGLRPSLGWCVTVKV